MLHKQEGPEPICLLYVALWSVTIKEINGDESGLVQDRHLSYFRIFLEPVQILTVYTSL